MLRQLTGYYPVTLPVVVVKDPILSLPLHWSSEPRPGVRVETRSFFNFVETHYLWWCFIQGEDVIFRGVTRGLGYLIKVQLR